jgi:two-component system, chemotaxis family, chemotaxis protein CheY
MRRHRGLALSHELVKHLDGALTMRASATSRPIPFSSVLTSPSARPLVLIIDDEPAVLHLLTRFLEPLGFQVTTAKNGERGMTQFLEQVPAVTIIDILMPVQDGIETILQMRRHSASANIIAMSGGAQIEGMHYLGIAVKLGANVALEKPIDFAKLLIAVRTLLYPKPVVVAHRDELLRCRVARAPTGDADRPARRGTAGTESTLSAGRSS